MKRRYAIPHCLLLLLVVLLGPVAAWARPKSDVLVMNNGDHITCEIINLVKAYLYVKLPYGDGTVSLDWSKVVEVHSPQLFVLTDTDGHRFSGTLQKIAHENNVSGIEQLQVEVVHRDVTHTFNGDDVVEIERLDTGFWANQHGSINFGFNLTKQDSRTQYNLEFDDTYSRERWATTVSWQSNLATGGGSDLRNDIVLQGGHQLRSPHNLVFGYNEYLQSNAQDLSLRITAGGGFGHIFRQTNNLLINSMAGLVLDRERYSTGARAGQFQNSLEALLGGSVNIFRFKTLNILLQGMLYPNLTNGPRVRFDFNASSRIRVARDLYWNLSYYLNTDSNPPSSSPKTDYGVSSGLGWTF